MSCSPKLGSELLPQALRFKYFVVMLMNKGKIRRDMNRQFGAGEGLGSPRSHVTQITQKC